MNQANRDRGELAIVLHSHMPYVEGFGTWPFGEEWLLEAIAASERATNAFVVPTMLSRIITCMDTRATADLSMLRAIAYGGGPSGVGRASGVEGAVTIGGGGETQAPRSQSRSPLQSTSLAQPVRTGGGAPAHDTTKMERTEKRNATRAPIPGRKPYHARSARGN